MYIVRLFNYNQIYSIVFHKDNYYIKEIYNEFRYVADPHGAVAYLGCKQYLNKNPNTHCVFLETAHPTKFLDVVEEVVKKKQALPSQIQSVIGKVKKSIEIKTYDELKSYLLKS